MELPVGVADDASRLAPRVVVQRLGLVVLEDVEGAFARDLESVAVVLAVGVDLLRHGAHDGVAHVAARVQLGKKVTALVRLARSLGNPAPRVASPAICR